MLWLIFASSVCHPSFDYVYSGVVIFSSVRVEGLLAGGLCRRIQLKLYPFYSDQSTIGHLTLLDDCIAPMGVTTDLIFDPVGRLMQLLCAPQICAL